MKEIHCGEFIAGCPHISRAETVDQLLESVREHARESHNMTEIDDGLKAELLKAIKER